MKNRMQLVLVLAIVGLVGVVIGQALPRPVAEAQQAPRQWRECFEASLWHHNGVDLASPGFRPRTVPVPAGWVPVGGGQIAVVLCR